jgi:hypothetical protein
MQKAAELLSKPACLIDKVLIIRVLYPPLITGRASEITICDAKIVICPLDSSREFTNFEAKKQVEPQPPGPYHPPPPPLVKDPRIQILNVRGTVYKLMAE